MFRFLEVQGFLERLHRNLDSRFLCVQVLISTQKNGFGFAIVHLWRRELLPLLRTSSPLLSLAMLGFTLSR